MTISNRNSKIEITNSKESLKKIQMGVQMVYQDPYDSINPQMKIKDIINEQHGNVGSLQPEVARALPNAISFLDLPNQDPYLQYRFGLALASALAVKNGEVVFDSTSAFGENLTVVARTEAEEEIRRP